MVLQQRQLLLILIFSTCVICNAADFAVWFVEQLKEFLAPDFPAETEDILLEAQMTTPELIARDGYVAETYSVETQDGYILGIHRIPFGKNNSNQEGRVPVLYIPGVSCSSAMFIDRENNSIGYILADNGYDVWMGNMRGNMYSRKHTTLSPDDKQFWMYTMDDIGEYDIPAIIDFILHETNSKQLQLITHSMGAVVSLMMFVKRPEYNNKVKGSVHMGPAIHGRYMPTLFRPFIDIMPDIQRSFIGNWVSDVFSHSKFTVWLLFTICPSQNTFLCQALFSSLAGYKAKISKTRIARYMNHCPTGASVNLFFQYAQLAASKEVKAFDYMNNDLNMQKYGQLDPPAYDFLKITSPMAFFYAMNDPLGDPIDVAVLLIELNSSVVTSYLIPDPLFTHADFTWGANAEEMVYVPLMEALNKMWHGPDPE